MKKPRVLSVLLTVLLLLTMIPVSSIFASPTNSSEIMNFVDSSGARIQITSTENSDGSITLQEYVNGQIIEKDVVTPGKDAISSTNYKKGVATNKTISASKYVTKIGSTAACQRRIIFDQ